MFEKELSIRPWGKYEKIFQESGVWIKRIEVNPRSRLSLQRHQHRSEHWIVVSGQGTATVHDREIPVQTGSRIDISLGAVHRMGNTGIMPLVFIELAWGKVLSEDDIIRIEDDYNRV